VKKQKWDAAALREFLLNHVDYEEEEVDAMVNTIMRFVLGNEDYYQTIPLKKILCFPKTLSNFIKFPVMRIGITEQMILSNGSIIAFDELSLIVQYYRPGDPSGQYLSD